MSAKTAILISISVVALFLLVAAALVWPQMQPRGLVVRDNAQNSRVNANREIRDEPEAAPDKARLPKPSTVIAGSTKPAEPSRPPFDMAKLEEGELLVRARVKLTSPRGLDIFRMAEREPWSLCVRLTQSPEDHWDSYFQGDAAGLVECAYPQDELPFEEDKLLSGAWSARICWNEAEAFVPIAAPKLEGRVLDFGTLEFDLNAALDPNEWLVIGRLVHTTGIPITQFDYLSMRFGGPEREQFWIGVREDGCFAFSAYELKTDDPAWLLTGEEDDEPPRRLPDPKVEKRFVDFGDIKLDCAAVEVHLAGWPDREMRRERHGLAGDDELGEMSLWISFSNYSSGVDFELSEPDTSTVKFLSPGPYRWYASQSDPSFAYASMEGELVLAAGKLTRLEIELVQAPCVLARFKAERPLEQVTLQILKVGADNELELISNDSLGSPAGPYAIANPEHAALAIFANARGYEQVRVDVKAGATECLIEFTKPAQTDAGRLAVVLPKLPEAFKNSHFRFAISLTWVNDGVSKTSDLEHIDRSDERWGKEEASKTRTYDVPKGAFSISLRERGPGMGYPMGIVCGPVEVVIEPDKLTVVNLPEIEAPPWTIFAQQTRARLTCEGEMMSYTGPVHVGETVQQLSLYYNHTLDMPNAPYAIPDGAAEIPLKLQLPDEEDKTAVYYHDFQARLEIRVKRGKELVPMQISARATAANGGTRTSSTSRDKGMLRLWAPVGKARIEVEIPGVDTLEREVDVKAELTVIEFEMAGSLVKLVWDERYMEEDGAPWLVRDAQDLTIAAVSPNESTLKLPVGHYTLAPQLMARPEVPFELRADSDVTVQVPFVGALDFSASMLVRFPKDLKPDPDGYAVDWRWLVPASGDVEKDIQARGFCGDSSWNRITSDGIKFVGLPVDVEFIFVLSIGALDDDDNLSPTAWAVAPMRIKLKGEGTETIALEWKRAVVLGDEWSEGPELSWTGPAAQGMAYEFYWRVMLPGPYVVTLNPDGESKTVNLTLKLEEGSYFKMSEDVRKALFGEEEPGGGDSGGD